MQNSNNIEQPLISVITPSFNSDRYIKETIDSVRAQTYPNWEMVIVDDGSKDRTLEIIDVYKQLDKRIRLITLDSNSGPATARNVAMKHANGRYIAFLDSDDQWYPEKLEKQLQFMQDNQVGFSFTQYCSISEDGSEIGAPEKIPDSAEYVQLLKNNVIGCLTVMIDTQLVGDIKMVNLRTRQDYVLWLHITKRGITAYGLKEVLAKYRVVENSISRNKLKMAKQNWNVYRKIEKISMLKSIWYFGHYMFFKLRKYRNI